VEGSNKALSEWKTKQEDDAEGQTQEQQDIQD
jgi:hypothetical protein